MHSRTSKRQKVLKHPHTHTTPRKLHKSLHKFPQNPTRLLFRAFTTPNPIYPLPTQQSPSKSFIPATSTHTPPFSPPSPLITFPALHTISQRLFLSAQLSKQESLTAQLKILTGHPCHLHPRHFSSTLHSTTPQSQDPSPDEPSPTAPTPPKPSLNARGDIVNTTSDNSCLDAVAASIPKLRGVTDENQYHKSAIGWQKPKEDYMNMSENQKQEIKERFALENAQRMHRALGRMRSTQGTMAYGQANPMDSIDGSMPQRNGTMSRGALDAFERAEEYKRRNMDKVKQKMTEAARAKQEQERLQAKKDFDYDPLLKHGVQDNEAELGEFSAFSDKMFKRTLSPEESEKQQAEQLLGKNWMAKWF